jgi:hypothetical protein
MKSKKTNRKPKGQRLLCSSDLLAAARALCEKLRAIHDDPQYQAVWTLAYAHGDIYRDGPNYKTELEALEAEIQKAANESSSPTAGGGSGGAQPKGTNEK